MNQLDIQRLSKKFPVHSGVWRHTSGYVQALQDISFEMVPGETLAVVGGSGSGKTTLAKILCGLLEADSGTVFWEGRPLDAFKRVEWARCIQMVFQDPYASLNPKLSVGTQLNEALRIAPHQTSSSAEDLLADVDLPHDAVSRYPFQFSGGQRQRIAIARALALNPKLLILDEPLSALDMATQDQIITLFQTVQKARGLSFLLITHDLGLAARLAERVIVLENGRLVEEGPAKGVLSSPQHPYTQALLEAVF
jgi:ABC-type glutathione transport system ATPase component